MTARFTLASFSYTQPLGVLAAEEAHRGARAPFHIQISPDALRLYGFHHNSGMLNLYSRISSAQRLLRLTVHKNLGEFTDVSARVAAARFLTLRR